jgi:hypothetical protein
MLAPMVRVLAHFLHLLLTIFGWDLLPRFILLLSDLVQRVLLVLGLLTTLVVASPFLDGCQLVIKFELALKFS